MMTDFANGSFADVFLWIMVFVDNFVGDDNRLGKRMKADASPAF